MNKETILQIARECGAEDYLVSWNRTEHGFTPENLERFAHRIEKETLLKVAVPVIKAWESLSEGRYTATTIQRWLIDDMKPAIDNLRRMAEKIGKD